MKMIINPDDSLNEIKENLRAAFNRAAEDTGHGLRLFSVASVNAKNNVPHSRMVVLRDFLPGWTFRFYTDFRSAKVAQMQNYPAISLLFWNVDERYQIRIEAKSTVHYKNTVSKSEWENISGDAQKEYTTVLPPGSEISRPEEARNRTKQENYFCVVDARATEMKVLQLNRSEHLAVKYTWNTESQEWSGQWIVP